MKTYIAEKLAILDAATEGPWHYEYGSAGHMVWADGMRVALASHAAFDGYNMLMVADSRNHRRAELEVIGMLWDALERMTGLNDEDCYSVPEWARLLLADARKKLETP